MGQAHVVEHRACIKQFGIESESATLARQSAPVIDAARMVKEQLSRTSSVISRASLLSRILAPARSVFIVRSTFIARLLPIDLEHALVLSFNRHPPAVQRIVIDRARRRLPRIAALAPFLRFCAPAS